jgi:hypothetical protein
VETASTVVPSESIPDPTPTPTLREFQADGGYYVDVHDLREAVVLAGGNECEEYEYWGAVAFADGTISCDGQQMMIDVFNTPEDLQMYKAQDIQTGNAASYDLDHTWLQGKNWLVRGETRRYAPLQEKLGGKIVTYSTGPSHR